jgi:hypothetical protein
MSISVWHIDADEVRRSPSHCYQEKQILKIPDSAAKESSIYTF